MDSRTDVLMHRLHRIDVISNATWAQDVLMYCDTPNVPIYSMYWCTDLLICRRHVVPMRMDRCIDVLHVSTKIDVL
jgi:hypothetical protein